MRCSQSAFVCFRDHDGVKSAVTAFRWLLLRRFSINHVRTGDRCYCATLCKPIPPSSACVTNPNFPALRGSRAAAKLRASGGEGKTPTKRFSARFALFCGARFFAHRLQVLPTVRCVCFSPVQLGICNQALSPAVPGETIGFAQRLSSRPPCFQREGLARPVIARPVWEWRCLWQEFTFDGQNKREGSFFYATAST